VYDGSFEMQIESARGNRHESPTPTNRRVMSSPSVSSPSGTHQFSGPQPEATYVENTQVYLQKLRWAVKEAGSSEIYADFIGSQFLGFDVDFSGSIPKVNDIVETASKALMVLVGFADLVQLFVDDFQVGVVADQMTFCIYLHCVASLTKQKLHVFFFITSGLMI
jgi:hypothetical protein